MRIFACTVKVRASKRLKSLYEKWLPTRVEIVSKSAIESYRIAYDHIQSIANIPINLI